MIQKIFEEINIMDIDKKNSVDVSIVLANIVPYNLSN